MARSLEEQMLGRLDQILRVLSLQVAADKSITERARLLKLAGMDNRTIAEVLNTTDATIRALTANLRTRAPSPRRRSARKKAGRP